MQIIKPFYRYLGHFSIPIFILITFLVAFICGPFIHLGFLSLMPGDIGDARLNNYFLENVYQYIIGHSESLWHQNFFFPFPYTLGFSDNLFGSAPVYVLARFLVGQSDTAYQIWFLFGYLVNFFASYYAFRKLKGSSLASLIGALIYTFALPTTAHVGHAQLHYRFGIPLAIVFFIDFLEKKSYRALVTSFAWLVWQYYAGIYMGFFASLLMATMFIVYYGYESIKAKFRVKAFIAAFISSWNLLSSKKKKFTVFIIGVLMILSMLLFYPYIQVTYLYGAKRTWGEISSMLPRPQSYFLSDLSWLWSNLGFKIISGITMRHEHQMFMGLVPLLLAVGGFIAGLRNRNGSPFTLMTGMLVLTIAFTLYVDGVSLWYFFHYLPLASAIRAITRLDQAILFPVAYLAAVAIDQIRESFVWGRKASIILLLPILISEFSMTSMNASPKDVWRQRIQLAEQFIPPNIPDNAILFMAQRDGPWYADELDVMWLSLNHGVKTLNGYSGMSPPGIDLNFGQDCSEIPGRITSYLRFSNNADNLQLYKELVKRVLPLGFLNCDLTWLITKPTISTVDRKYSPQEINHLRYSIEVKDTAYAKQDVYVRITNHSGMSFSALSSVVTPLRLSWRFLDNSGLPLSGWDTRKDLPFDIPAHGVLDVRIPVKLPTEIGAKILQVSLVQEGVFWAHDVGIAPATLVISSAKSE